jgi:hypothetical protein
LLSFAILSRILVTSRFVSVSNLSRVAISLWIFTMFLFWIGWAQTIYVLLRYVSPEFINVLSHSSDVEFDKHWVFCIESLALSNIKETWFSWHGFAGGREWLNFEAFMQIHRWLQNGEKRNHAKWRWCKDELDLLSNAAGVLPLCVWAGGVSEGISVCLVPLCSRQD